MKLTILVVALASLAAAYPPQEPPKEHKDGKEPPKPQPKEPERPRKCKPATYACLRNPEGWEVCNTQGEYEFAGKCPPKTVCKFYEPSLSPYCVPPYYQFP